MLVMDRYRAADAVRQAKHDVGLAIVKRQLARHFELDIGDGKKALMMQLPSAESAGRKRISWRFYIPTNESVQLRFSALVRTLDDQIVMPYQREHPPELEPNGVKYTSFALSLPPGQSDVTYEQIGKHKEDKFLTVRLNDELKFKCVCVDGISNASRFCPFRQHCIQEIREFKKTRAGQPIELSKAQQGSKTVFLIELCFDEVGK